MIVGQYKYVFLSGVNGKHLLQLCSQNYFISQEIGIHVNEANANVPFVYSVNKNYSVLLIIYFIFVVCEHYFEPF